MSPAAILVLAVILLRFVWIFGSDGVVAVLRWLGLTRMPLLGRAAR